MSSLSSSSSSVVLLVLLLVTSFLSRTALGTRCYACDSNLQPACGEPFFPDYALLFDCDSLLLINPFRQRSTMCTKSTMRLGDGTYRIQRTCGTTEMLGMIEGEMCRTNPNGEFICRCFGDACNGATSTTTTATTLVVVVASSVLLALRNWCW